MAVPTRPVLINGQRLVNLMMCDGVGTQVWRTNVTLEVDQDYFE